MKKLTLTVLAVGFAAALQPLANAQFGSGIVFDPTQSGHAIVQIEHEEQSIANQAQQIEQGQQIFTNTVKIAPHDRVVLIGDIRQHQGVEAGRPFEQLQEAGMRTARLDEIVRQQDPALKSAVELLATGHVSAALDTLQQQGRVKEIPNAGERIRAIAKSYVESPENTLIVSPDNASRRELNVAVRQELKATGSLAPEDHAFRILVQRQDMTGAERSWASHYEINDVVRYTRGSKTVGIGAGAYSSVVGIDSAANLLTIEKAKLRLWCLIAKGYTDIEIDYRATKRDWLEAQEIANELGEKQWATRASGELGLVAFLEGSPGRAARLLGGALLSTMASGDTGGQIRFLELIGRGFEEVNRHTEALRFFERAIKLADTEKDSGLPFMAYEGKARALVALGKPQEAKAVLDDALGKAQSQQKRGHEAELFILLGRLASQTGDRKQAIADLESAAQFSKRVQFFRMEADAMFELATLYRDAGDLPTAEERATDGLEASRRVGDRYYVPRNLTILADLKARRGRVSEANALYEQAEDVIESMLISVDEPYWNSSVAASMSQTYLQHFELVTKSGDVQGAFRVLEGVRGRTLAWALEDRKALPTAESRQTASLETDLAGLQVQLMQTNSTEKREQLLDKLVEYERRLGLAWTKEDAPGHGLPVQPASLSKVREVLKPDEVLLEYVLDDPTSFCVVVSQKGAYVRLLPAGRSEIENLSQQFVGEIRAKGTGTELSKRLYAMLVKPIPEAATATRFIIAPDAILNLLPFEALRDAQGEYLLKSRVISYVPSGTILNMLRHGEKQKPAPKPLLAVGDVEYENQGGSGRRIPRPASIRGRIERGIADLSGIGLHDLPETRAEVEEIGKIVGSDAVVLLGRDATETGFKKQPLDQFRILHLAVHGFADTQYPERSALVLGTDPQSADDGLLQVREIIRLRLNAELTILSACDSGVGKLQGQEGVSNLVEAFLVAGSKSVVASLWSADDTFATALMEQFYRRLAQSEDTSSALRNAKLDLLAKYGDQVSPFYWAAFIAVGETSTPIGIKHQ